MPTPVQGNSVPMAITGMDVISVAQTGSGKTLAFMLPIMFKLLEARQYSQLASGHPLARLLSTP